MTASLPPALVLTAGLGRRLRPLTAVRAKPAVPVAGTPLVTRILRWLAGQGVRDAVLNLHHRPDTITREVGHGDGAGLRVRYSWEPRLLGSAGGPRLAVPLLGPRFLIVNGDSLTDLSLRALVARHVERHAEVTMAVTAHPDPDRYGGVDVDETGAVRGFRRAGEGPATHFLGVQVAEATAFATLRPGVPAQSVGDLYDRVIADGPGRIRAFAVDAPFYDIGTVADYLDTTRVLAGATTAALLGRDVSIAPSAVLTETTVWDRVVVGARCRLHRCIVTDDVVLPDGVTLDGRICVAANRLTATSPGRRIGNAVTWPLPSPETTT